jgi:opacity protein-like surface antigen
MTAPKPADYHGGATRACYLFCGRMIHRCLVAAWVTGATLLSGAAYADCPDGWFCDDAGGAAPDAPAREAPGDRTDDRGQPPPPPPGYERGSDRTGQDDEVHMDFSPPPEPPRKKRRRKEYGVNLHGNLALFDADNGADSRGLAGVGAAFRFRPYPMFGVDLGVDFLAGEDWNGNQREERAFVANAIWFINPRHPLQLYALGGFGFGSASVDVERLGGEAVLPYETSHSYFGVQAGLGLEWRVTRRFALGTDALLFVRGRRDDDRRSDPEFIDPETHLVTNHSAFGLWRLGLTYYF